MQLGELPQQLLRALSCTTGSSPPPAQSWSPRLFLRALKTPRSRRRNFCSFCCPVESSAASSRRCRNFDLGSQAGFRHCDRHLENDVVAFAPEPADALHVRRDVEIPAARPWSGIAFSGPQQTRPILRSRRKRHFDGLFVRPCGPSPWQTGPGVLMRPRPSQRGHVRLNFMLPVHLALSFAVAIALRAGDGAGFAAARAAAGEAGLVAG